jgi:hypothetical protein
MQRHALVVRIYAGEQVSYVAGWVAQSVVQSQSRLLAAAPTHEGMSNNKKSVLLRVQQDAFP